MIRFALIAALCAVCVRAQSLEDVPRDGLLAAWVEDSASNDTRARDMAGSLHLNCSGGVAFARGFYAFDGTNDMLFASTANFAASSTSGTIIARVFLTAPTTTTFRILSSSDNATANNFGLLQISGGMPMWDNMAGAGTESWLMGTGAGVVTGRWTTAHFTTDGLFGQVGINGAGIAQTTNNAGGNFAGRWFSNIPNADHVAIGNFKRTNDIFSPGRVSALFVWTRKLSAAELMQAHLALSKFGVNQP